MTRYIILRSAPDGVYEYEGIIEASGAATALRSIETPRSGDYVVIPEKNYNTFRVETKTETKTTVVPIEYGPENPGL